MRLKTISAIGVMALMIPMTAAAQPLDPQAERLMAACKAASGGAALDRPEAFHEHGTFVRDGVSGTYDEYGDLRGMRTRSIHTFKDHVDHGGFDGTRAWRQGADGVVRSIDDPAKLKDIRTDAYVTIGGYFYPQRFKAAFRSLGLRKADGGAYDVVEATPDGGSPVDLWLDVTTHRLGRITTDAERDAYGDIFDYRNIDGTWIGFGSHQVGTGHKLDMRLESYRYEPLDAARFDAPR